jgi:hypothetical protein
MVGDGNEGIGRDEPRRKRIWGLFVFACERDCLLTTSTSSSSHPTGTGADSTFRRHIRRRVARKNRPSPDVSRRREVEREVSTVWRGWLLPREAGEGECTVTPCIWREREEGREEGEGIACVAAGEGGTVSPKRWTVQEEGRGRVMHCGQSYFSTLLHSSLPRQQLPRLCCLPTPPPLPTTLCSSSTDTVETCTSCCKPEDILNKNSFVIITTNSM